MLVRNERLHLLALVQSCCNVSSKSRLPVYTAVLLCWVAELADSMSDRGEVLQPVEMLVTLRVA